MRRTGFTVIELLVVIGIIVVVFGIIAPIIGSWRASARATACKDNLRQIAVGVDQFYTAQNRYPPGQFHGPYGSGADSTAWGWLARILPFVEQADLYKVGGVPSRTLRESGIADRHIDLFRCPADNMSGDGPGVHRGNLSGFPTGLTNYKAVNGANWGADDSLHTTDIGTDWPNPGTNGSADGQDHGDGMMYRSDIDRPLRKADITDGLSKTFMLGEDIPDKDEYCSWPYSNNSYSTCASPPNVVPKSVSNYSSDRWENVLSFRSAHAGGVHMALADGSVLFITETIDLPVYRAAATIRGKEPIDLSPWEE
jgi:type II secretory pathway pseudopilin PulG